MKLEIIEKRRYDESVVYEIHRTMTAIFPKDSQPETVVMGELILSVDSGLNTVITIQAREPFVFPLVVRTDVRSLKTNYESNIENKDTKKGTRKAESGE